MGVQRLRWLLVAIPTLATAWTLQVEPTERAIADEPMATRSHPVATDNALHVQPREHDDPVLANALATPAPSPAPSPDPSLELAPDEHAPTPAAPAGAEVFFGPGDANKVALTFDDGPSEELTPWVLNTLRRHSVRATFFVLGRRAKRHPELLARIAEEGHDLGSHGWSHTSLRSLFPEQIAAEVDDTNAAILAATGKAAAMFRPPFGRYAPSAIPLFVDRGMNLVLWNSDGRDWDGDADTIVTRVVTRARSGDIIVLHDRETQTARALPRIIEGLRAKGLEPVPVSELTSLPAYREPL